MACWRPRPDDLPEAAGEFSDPRVLRVLAKLKPMKRRVAEAYAFGGGITWADAEVEADAPAGYGARVRRRLKGLGKEMTARASAVQVRRVA